MLKPPKKNTPYYEYSKFLYDNQLSMEECKNSNFLSILFEKFTNLKWNINLFYVPITSLSNKYNVTKTRVRNDSFLKKSINKEDSFLISGIKLKNKLYFLLFHSKCFYLYNKSITSSNSIIIIDFFDILKFQYTDVDIIPHYGNNKNIPTYFYLLCSDDAQNIQNYLNIYINLINSIKKSGYESLTKSSEISKPISNTTRDEILNLFKGKCALSANSICSRYYNWEIISKEYTTNKRTCNIEIHHFIPKSYFKKYFKDVDWNFVNKNINLIPLCSNCHDNIHSGNENVVSFYFQSILDVYKEYERYNDFKDFLFKSSLDDEKLLAFYLKKM